MLLDLPLEITKKGKKEEEALARALHGLPASMYKFL
jgi:hypothetical protein